MSTLQRQKDRQSMREISHLKNPEVSCEPDDVNVRGVVLFGAAMLVGAGIVYLTLWGMFDYFGERAARIEPQPPPLAAERLRFPPEPRLQGAPGHEEPATAEMRRFREQQNYLLNHAGWVDQKAGVVRIPIDSAKELLLKGGLPARDKTVRQEGAAAK